MGPFLGFELNTSGTPVTSFLLFKVTWFGKDFSELPFLRAYLLCIPLPLVPPRFHPILAPWKLPAWQWPQEKGMVISKQHSGPLQVRVYVVQVRNEPMIIPLTAYQISMAMPFP